MGAANSSNSTDLITNVMSSISMDTSNNAAQAIINNQEINLDGCVIKAAGNVTMQQTANTVQQARQINKSMQNASVANDIAQNVAQEATSKVGSLGIGIANANNSVYAAVNASSDIKQAVSNATNQYSNIGNTFNCTRSTIEAGKDLNITQSSTASTLTNQVLDGQQAATINNKISQTVKQTASATVEGLAGLLVAIALIIAAFGYSVAKPLESGSFKIIIIVVLIVLLAVLVGFLYMRKAPPFFADSPRCQPSGVIDHALGCDESCVKPSHGVVNLKTPPLKYTLATTGESNTDVGKDVNMARQIINAVKEKANNGGYTEAKRTEIEDDIKALTKLLNAQGVKTTWQSNGDLIVPNPLAVYKDSKGKDVKFAIPSAYLMGSNPDDKTQGMCTPGAIMRITGGSDCGSKPTQWDISSTCPPTGAIACTALALATGKDTDDDIVAVYNDTDFDAFKGAATPADWDVLRFCYVHLINTNSGKAYIANNYGIADTDLVENSNKEIKRLKDAGDWAYKFTPSDGVTPASAGTASGGKLEGIFGFCDTQQYKINSFMQGPGKWIAIALLVALFGYLGFSAFRSFKP
jgi:hypothetical protein